VFVLQRIGRRLAAVLAALVGIGYGSSAYSDPEFELSIVSSRADTVSGGDVLVRLSIPPESESESAWSVQLNHHDVTASFRPAAEFGDYRALLTGLKDGPNTLEVWANRELRSKLEVVNHPLAGPIFSGPHQSPFVCQTVFNGLGPALDVDCRAKTLVQYYYKATGKAPEQLVDPHVEIFDRFVQAYRVFTGREPARLPPGFKPYDPKHPAIDVAKAVLPDGRAVDYIVRREVGVINRAIYDIRFLHRPGDRLPTPWSGHGTENGSAWNGRLVYDLSGGCSAGYRQGTLLGFASHEAVLARGYAVATSTLNIAANNCNDVLSAETLSMVKEYFTKTYGAPTHTIGWGDSGGAMELYLIAQNYPGLLDGIIPFLSFPDNATSIPLFSDCALLVHAFDSLKQPWTDVQKSAVTGYATWRVCPVMSGLFIKAYDNCNPDVPRKLTYDPVSRRNGARCDVYSNEINVFGRDSKTGIALRPLDNVGVQYGLAAFNSGQIDAEQFIALNSHIGGYDADGNVVGGRTKADAEAIERAYQHGLVVEGAGLDTVPIIDWRWYADDEGNGHDSLRSFVVRARLLAANGTAANQVILIYPRGDMTLSRLTGPDPESSLFAYRERELIGAMDRWLDNVEADHTAGTQAEKVARDKPSDLADACWTTQGEKITGPNIYGVAGKCSQIYPQYADPRIAAGAPPTGDVLKCQLKPVEPSDYVQPLTSDQLARLKATFPSGVCDYSKPGMGQGLDRATWQHF